MAHKSGGDNDIGRSLLELSRNVLNTYIKQKKMPEIDRSAFDKSLLTKKGCFVTLMKHGELRGCIGHIMPQESLIDGVIENTLNAALRDPRFPPVTADELDDIHMDISVLSVPAPLEFKNPEDLLSKLVPLKHGVILSKDGRQATYLPQVWEQLPDKVAFLESLCRKAGLGRNDWKSPEIRIMVYEATVYYS
ncbi:MAG: AmmeMemoRadiSam system protein A [Oligoflexales bacterium]|nr:AmmeMemoRadiSam system protein A [Oligoflexales bacterium]